MGTQDSSTEEMLDETLAAFERAGPRGTPLTASEVAEELDCARRTAYGKLEELADRGHLETKKVGARGRVWWRPVDGSDEGETSDAASPAAAEASDSSGAETEERSEAIESSGTSLEQAQFQKLAEAVNDYAIFVLDSEGRVQTWNDGAREIKGYDEDEILGEHVSTFYTDGDREDERARRNLEAAAQNGRIEDEGWRVRDDGTTFWANVTITALRDDDDELQGYVKITRDMTERHEYEERLREEKERFEALVREVKDYAIFLLDSEGTVQTWNEGAKQLKGYEEDEILGEHVSTFYTEEDREAGRAERNLAVAAEEGRVEDEGLRVQKDGSTFWANVVITALHDDDGEVRGYAKVTRDMTERHEYEERLREQRDELDELNQINAVIRDIDQALVTATTREEIEQAVCDRLTASNAFAAAWTGEYADDYEEMILRSVAGISDGYLDRLRAADGGSDGEVERGVGATALRTQAIQPVQKLGGDGDGEPWRESSLGEGYESAISVPLLHNEVEYGVLTVYADDESAFDERTIAVMSELGETVSHAIASIRRKERERTLTALQASTRELLHTESQKDIGDIIVDTLTEDLVLADAIVYCFNTGENTLDPVSSSFQAESYVNQLTPLTAGADSPVWTSFVEGETAFSDSAMPARELGKRQAMVVPLGDYGVLVVGTRNEDAFDRHSENLVELVAATAEAAFERVESQANLRERDELLQEQNQRLQRLNQINTIIREVDQGLVQAGTRDEVQRVVCERLTKSDRFRFAWIGAPGEVDDELSPQAWSGDGRGYLDSVDLGAAGTTNAAEPAVRTLRTGDVTVVSNVAENLRGGQWRTEAFSRELQSVVSVPLRYGDVSYGVLAVYADRQDVFGEMERTVFAELGETIANAINAVDTKQALLEEHAVELEFQLRDESTSLLARMAEHFDSEITFEGVIPLTEDTARLFFVVRDAPSDEVREMLERSVSVDSYQVIATDEEGHLVEAEVAGPTIALSLLEYGASLRALTFAQGDIQLSVELPSSADVREFIERFQARYESAELLARRQRERPLRTRDGFYAELESTLTDRQLEILETAYHSGFFDSPRRSTGGDVADLLDVSQPTVSEQLRTAHSKILELVFDDSRPDA